MKDKNKVELYIENENDLAESPFYDSRYRVLSWIDIPKGLLHLADSRGKRKEIDFKEKIGCAIPLKRSNGFLVLGTTHIYLYENDKIEPIFDLTNHLDKTQRCNDAGIDQKGRLWFSSIVDDGIHTAESKLYCFYNNELVCMDPNLKLGNGICWNKKGTRMFVSDSEAHAIYVYDYNLEDGTIKNRRVLCNIYDGIPDGMIIDKDEFLWIAIWGGSRIEVRNSKNGLLKKTYDIPTKNVTSLTYSKDEGSIIITTAKSGDSYGGKLFELKTDTKFPDIDYIDIE